MPTLANKHLMIVWVFIGLNESWKAVVLWRWRLAMAYYVLKVIDIKTKKVVQETIRKSAKSADRLYCIALGHVNPLIYKLKLEYVE
jgi:hypothetical protein